MSYPTPRRAGARWLDGDCPAGVLAIFDNGGIGKRNGSFDRFTIFYVPMIQNADGTLSRDPNPAYINYLAASEHPFDPQGFGQHGEMTAHNARAYRYLCAQRRQGCKWSELPEDVKRAVRQDLEVSA